MSRVPPPALVTNDLDPGGIRMVGGAVGLVPSCAIVFDRGSVSPAAAAGRSTVRRTVIPPSTHRLTPEQIRAASDVFGQFAHKSVDAHGAKDLLVEMNLLPPPGFSVPDALESVECPLERVSLEAFLYLVNGVWLAMEECVSHDMTVKHTYEAFQRMQQAHATDAGVGGADAAGPRGATFVGEAPLSVHSGAGGAAATTATTHDPLKLILSTNVHRGYRNLQQFLSPSQGEPEMLRSFINLGAQDQGAGYLLDTTRMVQRCMAVGMANNEAAIVSRIFDSSCSGDIDYDDFLAVMRTDLERLGLKPKLLSQLRKLLFANGGGASHGAPTVPPSMLMPSPALSAGGVDAVPPPMRITSSVKGREQQHQLVAVPGSGPAPPRKRSQTTSTSSQLFVDSDQDDSIFGGGESGEVSTAYGGAGRSLFHSISLRQPSIHELTGADTAAVGFNTPPSIFYHRLHEDLVQCRSELESLREYERAAGRLRAKATDASGKRPRGRGSHRMVSGGTASDLSSRRDLGDASHGSTTALLRDEESDETATIATSPSGQVLPTIHSGRQSPHGSGRSYGIGHNPAIPAYRYGVPPPPRLVHYPHRTPVPPPPGAALSVPQDRRLMTRHEHCATFFASRLTSPRRPSALAACGYAPSPRGQQKAIVTASTQATDGPQVNCINVVAAGGDVDARMGTTKTPEPLSDIASPSSGPPHRLGQESNVPALPLLTSFAQDRELRLSLKRLADFDTAVEKIVSPMPTMDALGNGASPTRSPRNFPDSPSNHRHRGGCSRQAAVTSGQAVSARPSALSSMVGRGLASTGTVSARRGLSPNSRPTTDEDTITDPSQAPAAVGYMLTRDTALAQQMFDRRLRCGQYPMGCVVDASLRRNGQKAQSLYRHPVPRPSAAPPAAC